MICIILVMFHFESEELKKDFGISSNLHSENLNVIGNSLIIDNI